MGDENRANAPSAAPPTPIWNSSSEIGSASKTVRYSSRSVSASPSTRSENDVSRALAVASSPRSASISSACATSAGDVATPATTPAPTATSATTSATTPPALSHPARRPGPTSTNEQASWS